MELSGEILSGYFFEGISGLQFISHRGLSVLQTDLPEEEIVAVEDYLAEGYGILNKDVSEAIRLVAETEGILLDPVYTGKAMTGLLDWIRKGRFDKGAIIVFLHSGGTPALFPYRDKLISFLGA